MSCNGIHVWCIAYVLQSHTGVLLIYLHGKLVLYPLYLEGNVFQREAHVDNNTL